ncbi:MAG: hypothetical protein IKU40_04015 [Clostridia bacterium]|nr:hypothetical protein [Clostridia bacterium]
MKFKRFSAALLAVLCLTSCHSDRTAGNPAVETTAETAAKTPIEVITELFQPEPKVSEDALVFLACSDLQHSSGHETAVKSVKAILGEIRDAGYDHADGAFFCGDYNWDFDGSVPGLYTLRKAVQREFRGLEIEDFIVVQGNHDPSDTPGLAPSGANDTDDFGVFVIRNDDYMWYNNKKQPVIDVSERLKTYLDEKIEQQYTKPIFILAHLPLHYSMRTYLQNDARYANFIFDVINPAAEAGLNIFYLFGHNHSNGWDDYLGGTAVYLAAGDTICIAQSSHKDYREETLAFTYLNAGYTGYYHDVNKGAETDLSMTVFQITEDAVTIERYTADGLHDLKSPGVSNASLDEAELTGLTPDKRTYESPQIIPLNKEITP